MAQQIESPDEEDLLAEVCDFEFEDTHFEDWKKVHQSLDITVKKFFALSEIARTDEVEIVYTRTVKRYQGEVLEKLEKEKKQTTLKIHKKLVGEQKHCFAGLGDSDGQAFGDLWVIIVITE